MTRKITLILILYLLTFTIQSDAQKLYQNYTFYFVDNSIGGGFESMNNELVNKISNQLSDLYKRIDNYFLFYGSNSEDYVLSSDLETFLTNKTFDHYIESGSNESNGIVDRTNIREFLEQNKSIVKNKLEINFVLSAYAANRIVKSPDELHTPALIVSELQQLIGNNIENLEIEINFYVDNEVVETEELNGEKYIKKSEFEKSIEFWTFPEVLKKAFKYSFIN